MHLFYADESNLDPSAGEFFVYAALAIPATNAHSLHEAVCALRNRFSVPPAYPLKFNPGPDNLRHEDFKELKRQAIAMACEHGCTLFTELVMHRIALSADEARRRAINRVIYQFDRYLERQASHGVVLIDRFNDKEIDRHIRERFLLGLEGMPFSSRVKLKRIVGLHYSAMGQSHFSSLIDILVGSMRFAINAYTANDLSRMDTAAKVLRAVAPLFCDAHGLACDLTLHFSPQDVKHGVYRERYTDLRMFLKSHGIG